MNHPAVSSHAPLTRTPAGPLFPEVGVIALTPERWGGMWLSRHQVLTRLAHYFRVLWFDPSMGWRQLWGAADAPKNHADEFAPGVQGFDVYRQRPWLPRLYRPRAAADFTRRRRLAGAHKTLRTHGCRRVILYLWLPRDADVPGLVPHDISCYHVADEYSFSPTEQPVSDREAALLRSVDQVFIHSPALMEKKGGFNPSTMRITNGVDFHAFAGSHGEPDDLRAIPHPRIGYVGRIKVQLDWEILNRLAAEHPQWSYVFVGPIGSMEDSEELRRALFARKNVYYLGNKSVAEVPAYTAHMDACILCYARTAYTRYIYPLKLHEYLAAGKPVVATDLESIRELGDVVSIADGYDDWAAKIASALSERADSETIARRRDVARRHDWGMIVDGIAGRLCDHLGEDYASRLRELSGSTPGGS